MTLDKCALTSALVFFFLAQYYLSQILIISFNIIDLLVLAQVAERIENMSCILTKSVLSSSTL